MTKLNDKSYIVYGEISHCKRAGTSGRTARLSNRVVSGTPRRNGNRAREPLTLFRERVIIIIMAAARAVSLTSAVVSPRGTLTGTAAAVAG